MSIAGASSDQRTSVLRALVHYNLPINGTLAELAQFAWDADTPLLQLSRLDIQNILSRFIAHELSASQVHDWADLIECRDDLDLSGESGTLAEIIFRLANPSLYEPLLIELAHEIVNDLSHR